jgi:hypothetical protein
MVGMKERVSHHRGRSQTTTGQQRSRPGHWRKPTRPAHTDFPESPLMRLLSVSTRSKFHPLSVGKWPIARVPASCSRRIALLALLIWDELLTVNNLTFYWFRGEPLLWKKAPFPRWRSFTNAQTAALTRLGSSPKFITSSCHGCRADRLPMCVGHRCCWMRTSGDPKTAKTTHRKEAARRIPATPIEFTSTLIEMSCSPC